MSAAHHRHFLALLLRKDWDNKSLLQDPANLDVSKFRLYDATRACRSIHWFCDQHVKISQLTHLNARSQTLDEDMVNEMLQNVSPKKPISDCAFSQTPNFSKIDAHGFLHGILQLVLFDRMKFSFIPTGDSVHRSPTLPRSRPERLSSNVKSWLLLGDEWRDTLSRFARVFARAANSPMLSGSSAQPSGYPILSSLAIGATQGGCVHPDGANRSTSLAADAMGSDDFLHYAAVKHNFCLASLGLYALSLPRKKTKKGAWQSELSLLKSEHGKSEPMRHLLDSLSENDLLRAIYFAIGFSPFSLLGNKRLTSDLIAQKTHLHETAEALCYLSRPEDESRLRIEHDLFRLIRKMAVEGSYNFDRSMRAILALDRSTSKKRNLAEIQADLSPSLASFKSINRYIHDIVESNYAFLQQFKGAIKPEDLRRHILFYIINTLRSENRGPVDLNEEQADLQDRKRRRTTSGSSLQLDSQPLQVESPLKYEHIRTVAEKWPVWPTTGPLLRRFKDVVSPMPKHTMVSVEAQDTWNWKRMKQAQKVALLKDQQVLMGSWAISDRQGPFRICFWEDEAVGELVNEDDWVQVNDLSLAPGKQRYRACLSAVFESIGEGNTDDCAFCCGYLPANLSDQFLPREIRDLDDGRDVELLSGSGQYEWKTLPPKGMSSRSVWVHIRSRSHISELKMTPAGLCTYIIPIIGSVRVYLPENIPLEKTDVEQAWKEMAVQDVGTWKSCSVERKQEILLKPGMPYFVVHDQDCMALVIDFYCASMIGDTLKAILLQHYYAGTDREGPLLDDSPITLLKLFALMVQRMKRDGNDKGVPNPFNTWEDVADLALLVDHLDQLQSRLSMMDPRRSSLTLWQMTDDFKEDFSHANRLMKSYLCFITQVADARKAFHSRLDNFKQLVLSLDIQQKHRRDLHVKVKNYKL